MSRIRMAALLVALAILTAACGARLSSDELRAAGAGQTGEVRAGDAGGTATAGATSGDAGSIRSGGESSGAATGGTATAGVAGGATGAGASAGAPGGSASQGPAPSAPPGGNGGATDVGVTATNIVVGNVSSLTGPVPGLFKGAVVGTKAYIAYLNSKGGIFGRTILLKVGDDKISADENRAQTINLAPQVFAFVGSFSTFDEAGAAEIEKRNIPDVGYSLSPGRQANKTNFSPQPLPPGWRLGPLNYFKQTYGDAVTSKVGALVVNVTSPKQAYAGEKAAMESLGYKIVYERFVQATESDFTADVVQMRRAGVEMLIMTYDVTNFVRVAKAMAQQNWKPKLMNWGSNAYDPDFLSGGGAAVEGSVLDQQQVLYGGEDRASVPEVGLFLDWMKRVDPSFKPDLFALYGWTSAMLFAQAAQAAGPKLTRAALFDALKKIDNFDGNGLLAPVGPASKRPSNCWLAIEVKGGKFVRKTPPSGFRCNDGGYFRLG